MIKNKLTISSISFMVLFLAMFAFAGTVRAADVTFPVNTTLSINSNDYTVEAGSEATTMTVGATTLYVEVPAGSYFKLSSASKYLLNNDAGLDLQCTGSVSILHINGERTLTITPDATHTCSAGGSTGGGGGTPADTTAPTGTVSVSAGATTTSTTAVTLTLSATDSVGVTHMLLSNDSGFAGASWETYATSKAWTLTSGDGTKTVYAKFKDAAGNMSASISDTITLSGSNTVATETPANNVNGCSAGNLFNTVTGQACGGQVANPGCSAGNLFNTITGAACGGSQVSSGARAYAFGTAVLKNGSRGEAVKELQRFLNYKLNLGLIVDGRLGPKTIAVIKKWQKDNGLAADGLIGPKTKIKMNASVQ